jgi:hypothetical protein
MSKNALTLAYELAAEELKPLTDIIEECEHMTDILTNELIEIAARAIRNRTSVSDIPTEKLAELGLTNYAWAARAALTAALPGIVEACAKLLDAEKTPWAALHAKLIRSLIPAPQSIENK